MKPGDLITRSKGNTQASWPPTVGLYTLSSGNFMRILKLDEILFVLKVYEDRFGTLIDVLTYDGAACTVAATISVDQNVNTFEVIS